MVKGESDAHVLFPHYLFGLLWELLYRLHQGVPWLPLFEYFFKPGIFSYHRKSTGQAKRPARAGDEYCELCLHVAQQV